MCIRDRYSVVVQMSVDIAETDAGERLNAADEWALKYIKAMYVALSVLALLVGAMRRDLQARAEKLGALGENTRRERASVFASTAKLIPILDSS